MRHWSVLCLASILASPVAQGGVANDIPSCYATSQIGIPAPISELELFVLVDQTTPLDAGLQNSVRENVGRLVQPGSAFVISSFSSFGQGHYLEILTAGTLEGRIAEKNRDSISVKALRNFDACMKGQLDYGRKTAAAALNKALSGSSVELAKSDVMASLKELSNRVSQSAAPNKVLFVISDMLENSSISSFYASQNVRTIDVAAELKKAESAGQFGDFGGARVFVIGAGLVQANAKGLSRDSGVYRNPQTISALRKFWEQYFVRSNAKLVEFGAPALLNPVK